MARKKEQTDVQLSPVDKTYEPRPLETRSAEDTAAAEGRVGEDQIPDYHQENPTLDTSGPEHDPEVQLQLRQKILSAVEKEAAKHASENPVYNPDIVVDES